VLEPLAHTLHLENLLLLIELERHVRGDRVGEPRRIVDARQRGQDLRRHLLVELHVLIEEIQNGSGQDLGLAVLGLHHGADRFGVGRKIAIGLCQLAQAHTLAALDQDLDRPVGELEQLQNRGQGADRIQIILYGIIDLGVSLRDEQNALVALHGLIERLDGFVAPHEEGDDHVRIHDDVAKRQDGYQTGLSFPVFRLSNVFRHGSCS